MFLMLIFYILDINMTEDRYNRKGVKLRQWRQEDMNQALRACREDNLGLRAAAR